MAANNLKQKDLAPLLGSESIVSEVLYGKRELNKQHIEKLSQRFKVSPALFFRRRFSWSTRPATNRPHSGLHADCLPPCISPSCSAESGKTESQQRPVIATNFAQFVAEQEKCVIEIYWSSDTVYFLLSVSSVRRKPESDAKRPQNMEGHGMKTKELCR